jgi:hypothetical protein
LARIPFILVGVALLAAAVAVAISVRAFTRDAERSDGVVTRLNAGGSHPQIEFTTASGRKISYPQGGLIFGYQSGQKVRVLYRATDPEQSARIDAIGALWATPVMLGIVAMFLFASRLLMKAASRSALRSAGSARRGEGQ